MNTEQAIREQSLAVVDAFFAALEGMDIPAFLELWHEDGVQHMPFAPDNFPKILAGKAAIQRQYGGLPDAYESMQFIQRNIFPLLNPTMVVAQYHGVIKQKSGEAYDNDYIGVFEMRDGKIASFSEYFNPLILMKSFGNNLGNTFSVGDQQ